MCTPFKNDAAVDGSPEVGPPCDFDAPFGPPQLVAGLEDIGASTVAGFRLSRNPLLAYFHAIGRRDAVNPYANLYEISRNSTDTPFSSASVTPIGVNTATESQADPTVSGDGRNLFFDVTIPPFNPYALDHSSASDSGFDRASPLTGAPGAQTPYIREDGAVLYFASVSQSAPALQTDLFRASWDGSILGTPVSIDELNTTSSEIYPAVTPDDRTIYWASTRNDVGSQGNYDIWAATRSQATDVFSRARNVAEVNTDSYDSPTFITSDGCTLYLQSNRSGSLLEYVATKSNR